MIHFIINSFIFRCVSASLTFTIGEDRCFNQFYLTFYFILLNVNKIATQFSPFLMFFIALICITGPNHMTPALGAHECSKKAYSMTTAIPMT